MWCLVALAAVVFLGGFGGALPYGDALLPFAAVGLVDESGDTESAADQDDGCDCPEDDENDECPDGCDACACCPAAAAPGSSPPHHDPVLPGTREDAQFASEIEAPEDGPRSRVFHPPRS